MSETSYSAPAEPRRSDFTRPAAGASVLDKVIATTMASGFDADAWVAMDKRDSALIEDEILNGAGSSKFIYRFDVSGKEVSGISVVGARELASHYGGIQHRLVCTVRKIGAMFIFTGYPSSGASMNIEVKNIPELKDEPDGFTAVCEVKDIKTGNSLMAEKFESATEWSRFKKEYFDRPHHATIAQSKAFRNAVLAVIPQAVQIRWKQEMMLLHKEDVITTSVIDEKRSGVLQYAAAKGVAVDRMKVNALTVDQISGLREATAGGVDGFRAAAVALGVAELTMAEAAIEQGTRKAPVRTAKAPPAKSATPAGQTNQDERPAPPPPEEEQQKVIAAVHSILPKQTVTLPAKAAPAPAEEIGGFEAFLVDQHGEMIDLAPFTDAVAWAESFRAAWRKSDDRDSLVEANFGAIQDASEVNAQAADILAALNEEQEANPAGPYEPPVIVLGEDRGRPAWNAYVKDIRVRLAETTAETFIDFCAANNPTFRDAPAAQRLLIVKAFAEHAKALGVPAPAMLAQTTTGPVGGAPAAPESAKPDPATRDAAFVDGRIADINTFKSAASLKAYWEGAVIQNKLVRLQVENSPEAERLKNAYRTHYAILGG